MSKRTRPHHSNRAMLERATMPSNQLADPARKPRNVPLPAPFYLAVDRQLKSGYDTYDKAEKAALAIKRQYPRLLVTVYETGHRRHIVIEQPKLVVSNGRRARSEGDVTVRDPVSATRH
jgi:hypothetical protein